MSKKGSSRDYAQAIYEVALEGWQKELQAVQDVLDSSSGLVEKLSNTKTKFATHQKNLDAALPKDTSDQTKLAFNEEFMRHWAHQDQDE